MRGAARARFFEMFAKDEFILYATKNHRRHTAERSFRFRLTQKNQKKFLVVENTLKLCRKKFGYEDKVLLSVLRR